MSPAGWGFWSDGGVGPARCRRRGAPVRLSPVPTRLRSSRPAPVRFSPAPARSCQPLTGLFRPTSANLLSVSVRLRPPRLRPPRLRPSRLRSSRPVLFLPALDRAAPAHLCQPPVRLRPPRLVLPPFRPLRPAFGCFYPHRSFRAGAVPLPLRGRAASRGAEVPAKTVITQNGVRERVPAGVYNLFIKIAAPRWPFGRSAVSLFTCKVSPPAPADAG